MIAGVSRFSSADLVPFYDAEIAFSDQAVGEVVRWLESTGVLDDTLIVVTSDHGELLGEQGRFSHQLYVDEPLMHIPLIVKLPHDQQAGTVIDSPLVSNMDVYTTLLAAAGVNEAALSGPSYDLAAGPFFGRSLLVGEYTPSRAYLRQLRAVNGAFDLEAHLRGRYVVYTAEFRTEIVGGRAVETSSIGGAPEEPRLVGAARQAEQALAAYLAADPPPSSHQR
jgi:arylsulfatase A-like enzyme